MPYSTNQDLLKEFSQMELARLSGNPTSDQINTDRIDYAREMADNLIDAYLYGRYAVPLTEPLDPLIRKLSIDLTVSNLFEFFYQKSSVPMPVVYRKLNAWKTLREIQSGVFVLNAPTYENQYPPMILSNKSEEDRNFSYELLKIFFK